MAKEFPKNNLSVMLDIFPTKIYFFRDFKSFKRACKWVKNDSYKICNDGYCMNLIDKYNNHYLYVFVDMAKDIDILHIKSLLVHEITHAVTFILNEYGIKDDETRAYLTQYLFIKSSEYFSFESTK